MHFLEINHAKNTLLLTSENVYFDYASQFVFVSDCSESVLHFLEIIDGGADSSLYSQASVHLSLWVFL
jgi:hypothetical protein